MTLEMQYREKYKEGRAEGRAETLKKLIKAGAEKGMLLQVYTEEEYSKAEAEMCDMV